MAEAGALCNNDVQWDQWPVDEYLDEVYRVVHPSDDAIIVHHSQFFRALEPGSVARSVEVGAGPNLYPLILAAAVSRHIDAVEPSAANLAYLRGQLQHGPEHSWTQFHRRCRALQPALPASLAQCLERVQVVPGDHTDLVPASYDLASMHFVAESCTEDAAEFGRVCQAFAASVRPGGHLVAAFMENMGRYRVGTGPWWPGYPVDQARVRAVFTPYVTSMSTSRVDFDTTAPDYGYTGMVLLTATC